MNLALITKKVNTVSLLLSSSKPSALAWGVIFEGPAIMA